MEPVTQTGSAQTTAGAVASVARAYFEAINDRDMARATALWQSGALDELRGIADLRAPEEISAWFEELFRAVPDISLEILSLSCEDDRAAVHWRMSGTFNGTGKLVGLAPNGRMLDIEGIDLLTIRDGSITSNIAYTNGLMMARQFGILPKPGGLLERAMYAPFNLIAKPLKAIRRPRKG